MVIDILECLVCRVMFNNTDNTEVCPNGHHFADEGGCEGGE